MAGAAVSLVLDFPFLAIFLAAMFFYCWQLTLIALAVLGLISLASILVTPILRPRLNKQFLLAPGIEYVQRRLAILCVGALLVMRNDGFTIGMLVAFQMFASRMSQPMLRLASLWQEFQQASISVKRLGDIMDAPVEPSVLTPHRRPTARARSKCATFPSATRPSSRSSIATCTSHCAPAS